MTTSKSGPYVTSAGLMLITGLGAFLRIHDLTRRSLTHLEMYVPGIRFPAIISQPSASLTLFATVKNTLSDTTYPPFYYTAMWAWTKAFGSGTGSLRLPSALCGIACIPLVFWVGVLTRQRAAGWIAALLVAANGYLVFFDQFARSVSLASLLGLLATILLLLMTERRHKMSALGPLYVIVVLLGTATHLFFWVLLTAHMAWTFANAWLKRSSFPAVGTLQVLACILASPLLAFVAYQSRNPTATLSANALVNGRELLQFSFLFPLVGFGSGIYPQVTHLPPDNPHLSILRWSFVLLALVLFVAGLASNRDPQPASLERVRETPPRSWLLAAAAATVVIVLFVVSAYVFARTTVNPLIHVTEAMAVIPLPLAGLGIWFKGFWDRQIHLRAASTRGSALVGAFGLVTMLAVVPFALLAAISLVKPILNARGMTLLGPFVLLMLASGIVRLGRRPLVAVLLCGVLAAAHVESLMAYRGMVIGRAEYKEFIEALAPEIEPGDLLFVEPSWFVTPAYYYLEPHWNQLVGTNYAAACRRHACTRVWTLQFYNEKLPQEMFQALPHRRAVCTIEYRGARAIL